MAIHQQEEKQQDSSSRTNQTFQFQEGAATAMPPQPFEMATQADNGFNMASRIAETANIPPINFPTQKKENGKEKSPFSLPKQKAAAKGDMPPAVQAKMEGAFDQDFSNVNIHQNSSEASSESALAFAQGNDIHFAPGEYQPENQNGQELLGHELAHVVQQREGKVKPTKTTGSGRAVNDDPALEKEADNLGKIAARHSGNGSKAASSASSPKKVAQRKLARPNNIIQLATTGGDTGGSTSPSPPTGGGTAGGGTPPNPPPFSTIHTDDNGIVNTETKTITIKNLKIPDKKLLDKTKIKLPKKLPEGDIGKSTNQRTKWLKVTREPVNKLLKTKLKKTTPADATGTADRYKLKVEGTEFFVMGTIAEITEIAARPYWFNKKILPERLQIDHIHETQLGGLDEIENYMLLDAESNRLSGSGIKDNKVEKINAIKDDAIKVNSTSAYNTVHNLDPSLVSGIKTIMLESVQGVSFGGNWYIWSSDDINTGKSVDELEVCDSENDENVLTIYLFEWGGHSFTVPWEEGTTKKGVNKHFGENFLVENVIYSGGVGEIQGGLFVGSEKLEMIPLRINIRPNPMVKTGGHIDTKDVEEKIKNLLRFKFLSPIEMNAFSLEPGKGAALSGKILPTVPMIAAADIGIHVTGNDITIDKTFTKEEFDFPKPFNIDLATLRIFADSSSDFGIDGQLDFSIDNIGEGHLKAGVSAHKGFNVEGEFNFESELFDPASIKVSYIDSVFTAEGEIAIAKGKIKGIEDARLTISYSEGELKAEGTVKPNIKGIEEGSLKAEIGKDGWLIGGSLALSDEIPGLKSGEVEVELSKGPEGYSFLALGNAVLGFPGVEVEVDVEYFDGFLKLEGRAAYEKGMLKGEVYIVVTDGPPPPIPAPSGGEGEKMKDQTATPPKQGDGLAVYGGGALTLTLTPWLQATAGVNFLPNGEIEIQGEIGIPDTVEVFERIEYEKPIFKAPKIQIPIFAIPLGPRSVGIVAEITGGIDFIAGVGPGELQELKAGISYNPSREEETKLNGHGKFVIPADAGLKLWIDAGLGVSLGIASVTGGVGVSATLGLEATATSDVDVNWTPSEGITIDAYQEITVNPKFVFAIDVFLKASLDLWLFEITERWSKKLAEFEYGSDLEFGLKLPIKYKEGEPFDLSFDDLEVIEPEIDVLDTVLGLGDKISDSVF